PQSGDQPQMTRMGDVLGTPSYMPPEQAAGAPTDERADVYALGAMLYHLLAGGPPYDGSSSAEILDRVQREPPAEIETRQVGIPPDLLTVVRKAMAREPAERYATAAGLAEDLKRFQTGQLVSAHAYTRGELLGRWLRRHRGVVTMAALALAL